MDPRNSHPLNPNKYGHVSQEDYSAHIKSELERFVRKRRILTNLAMIAALSVVLPLVFILLPKIPSGFGTFLALIIFIIVPILLIPLSKYFQSRKRKELQLNHQDHPESRVFLLGAKRNLKAQILIVHDDRFEFRQSADMSMTVSFKDVYAISYKDVFGKTFSKLFASTEYQPVAFGLLTAQGPLIFIVGNKFKAEARPFDAFGDGEDYALEDSTHNFITLLRGNETLSSRIVL